MQREDAGAGRRLQLAHGGAFHGCVVVHGHTVPKAQAVFPHLCGTRHEERPRVRVGALSLSESLCEGLTTSTERA